MTTEMVLLDCEEFGVGGGEESTSDAVEGDVAPRRELRRDVGEGQGVCLMGVAPISAFSPLKASLRSDGGSESRLEFGDEARGEFERDCLADVEPVLDERRVC